MDFKHFLLVVCLGLTLCFCEAKRSDKVRLEKIQTLTLNADGLTTGRRSSPIKQLTCVGGYCSRARVTSAQCYNRGFDGRDIQWECKAEMPSNYKFGKVEVICEGYDYPEDEYILAGSCGLEYTIDEIAGGGGGSSYGSQYANQHYHSAKNYIEKSDFSFIPIFFIVGLIALIYFTCLRDRPNQSQNAYSSTSDDYPRPSAPPPPAGFRSEYYDEPGASCSGGASSSRTSSQSRSSGPGLMSGLAAGGLLGYLFGSSRSNTYANRPYASTYGAPSSSSWGFGGPSTSSGYSGSSSGSETRTTSGFGSTRRR